MRLKRTQVRPNVDDLTASEARYLQDHFAEFAGEVLVHHKPILWERIRELQVVKAPRISGLSGLIVRYLIHGDERYHVGIYYDDYEAVLPNVTLNTARYVVQSIAYYAPGPIHYIGPEDLSPVIDD
ncbi:MAG: hypothetical protein D6737_01320 [Chloroflexi bacterium]|nr:MAG: hypothetical protein CUN54_07090 [Phototrophicales bacterium]RMF82583.1 MAG: hypothetical protein D6737_01320 [Chloroflexota bacterium]